MDSRPAVSDMFPDSGPLSGGTRVLFRGQSFTRGVRVSVTFSVEGRAESVSGVATDGAVEVTTPRVRTSDGDEALAIVSLEVGDSAPRGAGKRFRYYPDPEVTDVFPRRLAPDDGDSRLLVGLGPATDFRTWRKPTATRPECDPGWLTTSIAPAVRLLVEQEDPLAPPQWASPPLLARVLAWRDVVLDPRCGLLRRGEAPAALRALEEVVAERDVATPTPTSTAAAAGAADDGDGRPRSPTARGGRGGGGGGDSHADRVLARRRRRRLRSRLLAGCGLADDELAVAESAAATAAAAAECFLAVEIPVLDPAVLPPGTRLRVVVAPNARCFRPFPPSPSAAATAIRVVAPCRPSAVLPSLRPLSPRRVLRVSLYGAAASRLDAADDDDAMLVCFAPTDDSVSPVAVWPPPQPDAPSTAPAWTLRRASPRPHGRLSVAVPQAPVAGSVSLAISISVDDGFSWTTQRECPLPFSLYAPPAISAAIPTTGPVSGGTRLALRLMPGPDAHQLAAIKHAHSLVPEHDSAHTRARVMFWLAPESGRSRATAAAAAADSDGDGDAGDHAERNPLAFLLPPGTLAAARRAARSLSATTQVARAAPRPSSRARPSLAAGVREALATETGTRAFGEGVGTPGAASELARRAAVTGESLCSTAQRGVVRAPLHVAAISRREVPRRRRRRRGSGSTGDRPAGKLPAGSPSPAVRDPGTPTTPRRAGVRTGGEARVRRAWGGAWTGVSERAEAPSASTLENLPQRPAVAPGQGETETQSSSGAESAGADSASEESDIGAEGGESVVPDALWGGSRQDEEMWASAREEAAGWSRRVLAKFQPMVPEVGGVVLGVLPAAVDARRGVVACSAPPNWAMTGIAALLAEAQEAAVTVATSDAAQSRRAATLRAALDARQRVMVSVALDGRRFAGRAHFQYYHQPRVLGISHDRLPARGGVKLSLVVSGARVLAERPTVRVHIPGVNGAGGTSAARPVRVLAPGEGAAVGGLAAVAPSATRTLFEAASPAVTIGPRGDSTAQRSASVQIALNGQDFNPPPCPASEALDRVLAGGKPVQAGMAAIVVIDASLSAGPLAGQRAHHRTAEESVVVDAVALAREAILLGLSPSVARTEGGTVVSVRGSSFPVGGNVVVRLTHSSALAAVDTPRASKKAAIAAARAQGQVVDVDGTCSASDVVFTVPPLSRKGEYTVALSGDGQLFTAPVPESIDVYADDDFAAVALAPGVVALDTGETVEVSLARPLPKQPCWRLRLVAPFSSVRMKLINATQDFLAAARLSAGGQTHRAERIAQRAEVDAAGARVALARTAAAAEAAEARMERTVERSRDGGVVLQDGQIPQIREAVFSRPATRGPTSTRRRDASSPTQLSEAARPPRRLLSQGARARAEAALLGISVSEAEARRAATGPGADDGSAEPSDTTAETRLSALLGRGDEDLAPKECTDGAVMLPRAGGEDMLEVFDVPQRRILVEESMLTLPGPMDIEGLPRKLHGAVQQSALFVELAPDGQHFTRIANLCTLAFAAPPRLIGVKPAAGLARGGGSLHLFAADDAPFPDRGVLRAHFIFDDPADDGGPPPILSVPATRLRGTLATVTAPPCPIQPKGRVREVTIVVTINTRSQPKPPTAIPGKAGGPPHLVRFSYIPPPAIFSALPSMVPVGEDAWVVLRGRGFFPAQSIVAFFSDGHSASGNAGTPDDASVKAGLASFTRALFINPATLLVRVPAATTSGPRVVRVAFDNEWTPSPPASRPLLTAFAYHNRASAFEVSPAMSVPASGGARVVLKTPGRPLDPCTAVPNGCLVRFTVALPAFAAISLAATDEVRTVFATSRSAEHDVFASRQAMDPDFLSVCQVTASVAATASNTPHPSPASMTSTVLASVEAAQAATSDTKRVMSNARALVGNEQRSSATSRARAAMANTGVSASAVAAFNTQLSTLRDRAARVRASAMGVQHDWYPCDEERARDVLACARRAQSALRSSSLDAHMALGEPTAHAQQALQRGQQLTRLLSFMGDEETSKGKAETKPWALTFLSSATGAPWLQSLLQTSFPAPTPSHPACTKPETWFPGPADPAVLAALEVAVRRLVNSGKDATAPSSELPRGLHEGPIILATATVPGVFEGSDRVVCASPSFPVIGPARVSVSFNGQHFCPCKGIVHMYAAPQHFSLRPAVVPATGSTPLSIVGSRLVPLSGCSMKAIIRVARLDAPADCSLFRVGPGVTEEEAERTGLLLDQKLPPALEQSRPATSQGHLVRVTAALAGTSSQSHSDADDDLFDPKRGGVPIELHTTIGPASCLAGSSVDVRRARVTAHLDELGVALPALHNLPAGEHVASLLLSRDGGKQYVDIGQPIFIRAGKMGVRSSPPPKPSTIPTGGCSALHLRLTSAPPRRPVWIRFRVMPPLETDSERHSDHELEARKRPAAVCHVRGEVASDGSVAVIVPSLAVPLSADKKRRHAALEAKARKGHTNGPIHPVARRAQLTAKVVSEAIDAINAALELQPEGSKSSKGTGQAGRRMSLGTNAPETAMLGISPQLRHVLKHESWPVEIDLSANGFDYETASPLPPRDALMVVDEPSVHAIVPNTVEPDSSTVICLHGAGFTVEGGPQQLLVRFCPVNAVVRRCSQQSTERPCRLWEICGLPQCVPGQLVRETSHPSTTVIKCTVPALDAHSAVISVSVDDGASFQPKASHIGDTVPFSCPVLRFLHPPFALETPTTPSRGGILEVVGGTDLRRSLSVATQVAVRLVPCALLDSLVHAMFVHAPHAFGALEAQGKPGSANISEFFRAHRDVSWLIGLNGISSDSPVFSELSSLLEEASMSTLLEGAALSGPRLFQGASAQSPLPMPRLDSEDPAGECWVQWGVGSVSPGSEMDTVGVVHGVRETSPALPAGAHASEVIAHACKTIVARRMRMARITMFAALPSFPLSISDLDQASMSTTTFGFGRPVSVRLPPSLIALPGPSPTSGTRAAVKFRAPPASVLHLKSDDVHHRVVLALEVEVADRFLDQFELTNLQANAPHSPLPASHTIEMERAADRLSSILSKSVQLLSDESADDPARGILGEILRATTPSRSRTSKKTSSARQRERAPHPRRLMLLPHMNAAAVLYFSKPVIHRISPSAVPNMSADLVTVELSSPIPAKMPVLVRLEGVGDVCDFQLDAWAAPVNVAAIDGPTSPAKFVFQAPRLGCLGSNDASMARLRVNVSLDSGATFECEAGDLCLFRPPSVREVHPDVLPLLVHPSEHAFAIDVIGDGFAPAPDLCVRFDPGIPGTHVVAPAVCTSSTALRCRVPSASLAAIGARVVCVEVSMDGGRTWSRNRRSLRLVAAPVPVTWSDGEQGRPPCAIVGSGTMSIAIPVPKWEYFGGPQAFVRLTFRPSDSQHWRKSVQAGLVPHLSTASAELSRAVSDHAPGSEKWLHSVAALSLGASSGAQRTSVVRVFHEGLRLAGLDQFPKARSQSRTHDTLSGWVAARANESWRLSGSRSTAGQLFGAPLLNPPATFTSERTALVRGASILGGASCGVTLLPAPPCDWLDSGTTVTVRKSETSWRPTPAAVIANGLGQEVDVSFQKGEHHARARVRIPGPSWALSPHLQDQGTVFDPRLASGPRDGSICSRVEIAPQLSSAQPAAPSGPDPPGTRSNWPIAGSRFKSSVKRALDTTIEQEAAWARHIIFRASVTSVPAHEPDSSSVQTAAADDTVLQAAHRLLRQDASHRIAELREWFTDVVLGRHRAVTWAACQQAIVEHARSVLPSLPVTNPATARRIPHHAGARKSEDSSNAAAETGRFSVLDLCAPPHISSAAQGSRLGWLAFGLNVQPGLPVPASALVGLGWSALFERDVPLLRAGAGRIESWARQARASLTPAVPAIISATIPPVPPGWEGECTVEVSHSGLHFSGTEVTVPVTDPRRWSVGPACEPEVLTADASVEIRLTTENVVETGMLAVLFIREGASVDPDLCGETHQKLCSTPLPVCPPSRPLSQRPRQQRPGTLRAPRNVSRTVRPPTLDLGPPRRDEWAPVVPNGASVGNLSPNVASVAVLLSRAVVIRGGGAVVCRSPPLDPRSKWQLHLCAAPRCATPTYAKVSVAPPCRILALSPRIFPSGAATVFRISVSGVPPQANGVVVRLRGANVQENDLEAASVTRFSESRTQPPPPRAQIARSGSARTKSTPSSSAGQFVSHVDKMRARREAVAAQLARLGQLSDSPDAMGPLEVSRHIDSTGSILQLCILGQRVEGLDTTPVSGDEVQTFDVALPALASACLSRYEVSIAFDGQTFVETGRALHAFSIVSVSPPCLPLQAGCVLSIPLHHTWSSLVAGFAEEEHETDLSDADLRDRLAPVARLRWLGRDDGLLSFSLIQPTWCGRTLRMKVPLHPEVSALGDARLRIDLSLDGGETFARQSPTVRVLSPPVLFHKAPHFEFTGTGGEINVHGAGLFDTGFMWAAFVPVDALGPRGSEAAAVRTLYEHANATKQAGVRKELVVDGVPIPPPLPQGVLVDPGTAAEDGSGQSLSPPADWTMDESSSPVPSVSAGGPSAVLVRAHAHRKGVDDADCMTTFPHDLIDWQVLNRGGEASPEFSRRLRHAYGARKNWRDVTHFSGSGHCAAVTTPSLAPGAYEIRISLNGTHFARAFPPLLYFALPRPTATLVAPHAVVAGGPCTVRIACAGLVGAQRVFLHARIGRTCAESGEEPGVQSAEYRVPLQLPPGMDLSELCALLGAEGLGKLALAAPAGFVYTLGADCSNVSSSTPDGASLDWQQFLSRAQSPPPRAVGNTAQLRLIVGKALAALGGATERALSTRRTGGEEREASATVNLRHEVGELRVALMTGQYGAEAAVEGHAVVLPRPDDVALQPSGVDVSVQTDVIVRTSCSHAIQEMARAGGLWFVIRTSSFAFGARASLEGDGSFRFCAPVVPASHFKPNTSLVATVGVAIQGPLPVSVVEALGVQAPTTTSSRFNGQEGAEWTGPLESLLRSPAGDVVTLALMRGARVANLEPRAGPLDGGTHVVLRGAGWATGCEVWGTLKAGDWESSPFPITVESASRLSFRSPEGPPMGGPGSAATLCFKVNNGPSVNCGLSFAYYSQCTLSAVSGKGFFTDELLLRGTGFRAALLEGLEPCVRIVVKGDTNEGTQSRAQSYWEDGVCPFRGAQPFHAGDAAAFVSLEHIQIVSDEEVFCRVPDGFAHGTRVRVAFSANGSDFVTCARDIVLQLPPVLAAVAPALLPVTGGVIVRLPCFSVSPEDEIFLRFTGPRGVQAVVPGRVASAAEESEAFGRVIDARKTLQNARATASLSAAAGSSTPPSTGAPRLRTAVRRAVSRLQKGTGLEDDIDSLIERVKTAEAEAELAIGVLRVVREDDISMTYDSDKELDHEVKQSSPRRSEDATGARRERTPPARVGRARTILCETPNVAALGFIPAPGAVLRGWVEVTTCVGGEDESGVWRGGTTPLTFYARPPVVDEVKPAEGPVWGGQIVHVFGDGFVPTEGSARVRFVERGSGKEWTVPATYVCPTEVTCLSPAVPREGVFVVQVSLNGRDFGGDAGGGGEEVEFLTWRSWATRPRLATPASRPASVLDMAATPNFTTGTGAVSRRVVALNTTTAVGGPEPAQGPDGQPPTSPIRTDDDIARARAARAAHTALFGVRGLARARRTGDVIALTRAALDAMAPELDAAEAELALQGARERGGVALGVHRPRSGSSSGSRPPSRQRRRAGATVRGAQVRGDAASIGSSDGSGAARPSSPWRREGRPDSARSGSVSARVLAQRMAGAPGVDEETSDVAQRFVRRLRALFSDRAQRALVSRHFRLLFIAMDKDGNWRLDFEEFTGGMARLFPNVSEAEILALWEHCDVDRSGDLSLEEFMSRLGPGVEKDPIGPGSYEPNYDVLQRRSPRASLRALADLVGAGGGAATGPASGAPSPATRTPRPPTAPGPRRAPRQRRGTTTRS